MPEPDDAAAARSDEISPSLYAELERSARALLAKHGVRDRPETASLVNRACVKVLGKRRQQFESRAKLLAYAARAMENVLVDLARERRALKRGAGAAPEPLLAEAGESALPAAPSRDFEAALDVAEFCADLQQHDPHLRELIQLRFFAGLTWPEVAEVNGRQPAENQADWEFVRALAQSRFGAPEDRRSEAPRRRL